MFDAAKCAEVLAGAKALAHAGGAIAIHDHFAGYFNELGLWITFADETSDRELIAVGSKLLGYLNEALPRGNAHFEWLLCLERGGDNVVLVSGDTGHDLVASLSVLR